MAASSDWSRAVVVRSDGAHPAVVTTPAHANAVARDLAAAGDPIRVRRRDASPSCNDDSSGGTVSCRAPSSVLGRVVASVLGSRDDATFWVPDATRGEVGLLETLHRRGEGNCTPVLLQSRPLPELQCNFSTCTGLNIDLSHNLFRLSKVANAVSQMHSTLRELARDDAASPRGGRSAATSASSGRGGGADTSLTFSARTFSSTVRAGLQALQDEDYYLVKYRDYSAWAVRTYRELAQRDGLLGRRYVEQCFVVHVGREPGELIPVTEAQFLFGVDLLQRQLLNELASAPSASTTTAAAASANEASYAHYQYNINFCALNADQYRSLGVVLGDGLRPVGVEADERRRRARRDAAARRAASDADGSDGGAYVPPAWYDWSPHAIRTRVRHRLSCCYRSIGQVTVQVTVLAVCAYVLYRSVHAYLPAADAPLAASRRHGSRGGGGSDADRGARRERGGWYGDAYYRADDEELSAHVIRRRPGLWRSVLMGPKDVFDYLLAPSS